MSDLQIGTAAHPVSSQEHQLAFQNYLQKKAALTTIESQLSKILPNLRETSTRQSATIQKEIKK